MIANIVWPALYLLSRLLSFSVIVSSLFVEYFFLWKFLELKPKRAALADVVMNLASSVAGIVLIGLFGLIVVLPFRNTFGVGAWVATFVLAVIANASIESLVVNKWFKSDFGKNHFYWLVAANALTVGIAYGSLALFPIEM